MQRGWLRRVLFADDGGEGEHSECESKVGKIRAIAEEALRTAASRDAELQKERERRLELEQEMSAVQSEMVKPITQ